MKNALEEYSISHNYFKKIIFFVVPGGDFIYHFSLNQCNLPTQMGKETKKIK